jgi:hypothetical protein
MAVVAATAAKVAASFSAIAPAVTAASGVIGTVASFSAAKRQQQELEFQAQQDEENAKRAIAAAQTQAQDRDLNNLVQLDAFQVQQAGSGLRLDSVSSRRRRNLNRVLARRDSLRIIDDGEVQANNLTNRGQTARENSKQVNPFITGLISGLSATSSVISASSSIDPKTRQNITGAVA